MSHMKLLQMEEMFSGIKNVKLHFKLIFQSQLEYCLQQTKW